MKNYIKCLTGLHLQKWNDMWTGQKNPWYNRYIHEQKKIQKTGIESTKNTEMMTTGGPTPLKETSTTDY